jgi:LemA protein
MNPTIVVGLLMVCFAVYTILTYNVLLRLRANTLKAWAQIEVAVARKAELMPQLMNLAESEEVQERRMEVALRHWMEARGVNATATAHSELSTVFRSFMRDHQNDEADGLKAIRDEIVRSDNKIEFAQQYYNDAVTAYNLALERIPSFLVARMGGFKKRQLFEPVPSMDIPDEIEDEELRAPRLLPEN